MEIDSTPDRARRGEPARDAARDRARRDGEGDRRGARAASSARSPRRRRSATRSPPAGRSEKEALERVKERHAAHRRAAHGGRARRARRATSSASPRSATASCRRSSGSSPSATARRASPMVKEEVDEDDVAAVVARWTGIPVDRLLEGETEKLVHMEERLHQRVVGQDEAVAAVANALRRARTGLQDPDRPIGSFVFLGPTGVGKTELARALAEFMFDDERAMVRLDMSRVPGEAHGLAARRRAARLRRLRRGRPADRGGAAPPVLRRAARRDREGARRGVRRAAAGARRRAADRRPGPHGRLPQRGADHDLERPHAPRRCATTSGPSS